MQELRINEKTYKAWVIQNTHALLNPFCWSSYRVQHILDEDSVTRGRVIDQNTGHRADELTVLHNRTAAHE